MSILRLRTALLGLAVLAVLAAPATLRALEPFPAVSNLSARFVPGANRVRVEWDAVPGAVRYGVALRSARGSLIASARTRVPAKGFAASLFRRGRGYVISVRVRRTAERAASPARRLRYTHLAAPEVLGRLRAVNSAGRHGAYFLPAGYNVAPLPLLVAYHGTGGSGDDMVGAFLALARRRGFIVVAADSRIDPGGNYNWEVGTNPGEITPDFTHVQNCIAEVLGKNGVSASGTTWIAAGHSGGGSSAPYLATNDTRFAAFAVLHGGAFPGGLGGNVIPGWFSTGSHDTIRPPALVQDAAAEVAALGFPVVYREFDAGHELGDAEKAAVASWWLE